MEVGGVIEVKAILIALAIAVAAAAGVWAYKTGICCGKPSAPCCPLKK